MTESNKGYVSELIGDDFKDWTGRKVLLGCGTGRGKTQFALNRYSRYELSQHRTVLYLCNRATLRKQVEENIKKFHLDIDCITYQKFTKQLRIGESVPLYDSYICDEAHYFLADAGFNLYTDMVYEYLMNLKSATVIFMTATYRNIFDRIKTDIKKNDEVEPLRYYLPTDYSYVDRIYWFRGSSVKGIIDMILKEYPEDKIMYFCNSMNKMENLYKEYSPDKGKGQDEKFIEDSTLKYMNFMCSEYNLEDSDSDDTEDSDTEDSNADDTASKKKKKKANKDITKNSFAKKHCRDDAIRYDERLKGYTFDNKILVTTKVLDNGIDFKDRKIKHIICDIFDIESAIQSLGRKRIIDKDDTCIFYIRDYQRKDIQLFLYNTREQLKSPKLFLDDIEKWIDEYGKDREYKDYTLFYDFQLERWSINYMRYQKLLLDESNTIDMNEEKTSYREMILDYLGETVADASVDMADVEAEKQMDSIEIYLKKHTGVRLSKEQQKEFVKLCDIRDRFNRLQTSISIIQNYLKDMQYPYSIKSKRFRVKGKLHTYWIISNLQVEDGKGNLDRPPPK